MTKVRIVIDFLSDYSDAFVAFAAIIAVLTFILNYIRWKRQMWIERDVQISEQAKKALLRAYESLEVMPENGIPRPDRLNWLTSSRHIIQFELLKSKLKTKTFKIIIEEEEEHWRHRFYTLLDNKRLAQSAYYRKPTQGGFPENIEPTSAKVVIGFSNWPDDKNDPIDSKKAKKLVKNDNCFKGQAGIGLKSYLEALDNAVIK